MKGWNLDMEKSKFNVRALIFLVAAVVLAILTVIMNTFQYELAVYVAGSLSVVLFITSVLFDFLDKNKKTWIEYLSIGINFFASVITCAFVIATINDDKIQTIVLTLAAAVYGGLFTLVGVAWTIKWTQEQNHIEHKNSIKPFFSYISVGDFQHEQKNHNVINSKWFGSEEDYTKYKNEEPEVRKLVIGYFKNSDKVEFSIQNIILDGIRYNHLSGTKSVFKNDVFQVVVVIKSNEIKDIKTAGMTMEDVDGNLMFAKFKLENVDMSCTNELMITGIEYTA